MSIVDILSSPPGGLAYHLIMLFAIQAVLGMVLDEVGRGRQPQYGRIAIAFGILFLSRLFLMAVALVTWQGFIPPQDVLPPLERFLDLLGIILLFYAISPGRNRLAVARRIFFATNVLLALIVYVIFAVLWYSALRVSPELHYNGYWQGYVWELWQVVVAILGLAIILSRHIQQKVLVSSIFVIFALGHVVHLLSLQGGPHIAGWGRVANIIVYPLFAAMIYRMNAAYWGEQKKAAETTAAQLDSGLRERVIGVCEVTPQDIPDLGTTGYIESSLELPVVLQRAAENTMKAFDTDLVALLIRRVASAKSLEIAAIRHRSGLYETNKGRIDLSKMPILRRVLQKQKQIIPQQEEDDTGEWSEFLKQIGAPSDYNLIVRPLVAREISIGLLVIADHSLPILSVIKNDQRMAHLSDVITAAIGNALLYEAALTRLNDLETQLHTVEQQVAEPATEKESTPPSSAEESSDQQLIELWQAQLEFERVQREACEQSAKVDKQLVASLQEEVAQLQSALTEARSRHAQPVRGAGLELIEQLEAELRESRRQLQHARKELEETRPTLQERFAHVDTDLVRRLEAELEKSLQKLKLTQQELQEAHQQLQEQNAAHAEAELHKRDPESDLDLIEHLQSELAQARFDVEQTRENLRETGETVQHQEKELAKRTERIDELEAKLQNQAHEGRLISTIIHQDLHIPLKLLEGYADLLLGGSLGFLGESQSKFVQRIRSNIERMRNVLDNLDLLTMLDSGTLKIEAADINLSTFIDNVITRSKAQMAEKQVDIKVSVPSNLPTLRADASKLEQVINNLLSNAFKCSPPTSEVRISAEVRKEGDEQQRMLGPFIVISIKDAGGGIDSKQQTSIFNRPDQAKRYPIKGLGERGIGLVVAKELIEAHGGQIWFETQEGEGTTFAFALPVNGNDVRVRPEGPAHDNARPIGGEA